MKNGLSRYTCYSSGAQGQGDCLSKNTNTNFDLLKPNLLLVLREDNISRFEDKEKGENLQVKHTIGTKSQRGTSGSKLAQTFTRRLEEEPRSPEEV